MMEPMGEWKRTNTCGELDLEDIGRDVILMGWVHSRRDLGGLIFVDLRDREGITQLVFDPQADKETYNKAKGLKDEYVIAVRGQVSRRLEGQENLDLKTGRIEVKAKELRILNTSYLPPFQIYGAVDGSETLRLRYRYLEMRRHDVMSIFRLRHRIGSFIRGYLDKKGFIEVETPFLTKSTPEGARDYLVPSRINKGKFYALPQSPQLFKQILMVAGFDKYYQIVRCFRDEDLRADRQPEFTQVDVEMSFVDENEIMRLFDEMMKELFREIMGHEISVPIPRLEYKEAMDRFGSDKPDTRFGMELKDITDIAKETGFKIFQDIVSGGGIVKAIVVKNASLSRKELDNLSEEAKQYGAKGIFWAKVTKEEWQSPIKKYIDEKRKKEINRRLSAEEGDIIVLIADAPEIANEALGIIRKSIARRMGLIKENIYSFVWINRFPLFQYNEEEQRIDSVHHPFTSPADEDIGLLEKEPTKVRARAYDLVLNGEEIGGGSIRIHLLELQKRIFKILGISEKEAQEKFGFFLEALRYGAPPHGGMALGFDRLVAIIAGKSSIREVIPFPKTTSATCPLTGAPSEVDYRQLQELGIRSGGDQNQGGKNGEK